MSKEHNCLEDLVPPQTLCEKLRGLIGEGTALVWASEDGGPFFVWERTQAIEYGNLDIMIPAPTCQELLAVMPPVNFSTSCGENGFRLYHLSTTTTDEEVDPNPAKAAAQLWLKNGKGKIMKEYAPEDFCSDHMACEEGYAYALGFETMHECYEDLLQGGAGSRSFDWALWILLRVENGDKLETSLHELTFWLFRQVAPLLPADIRVDGKPLMEALEEDIRNRVPSLVMREKYKKVLDSIDPQNSSLLLSRMTNVACSSIRCAIDRNQYNQAVYGISAVALNNLRQRLKENPFDAWAEEDGTEPEMMWLSPCNNEHQNIVGVRYDYDINTPYQVFEVRTPQDLHPFLEKLREIGNPFKKEKQNDNVC